MSVKERGKIMVNVEVVQFLLCLVSGQTIKTVARSDGTVDTWAPTQFSKNYFITNCTDACIEITIPRD